MMTTYERRQHILKLLREQESASVTDLAQWLAVSEGTIRNDLTALEHEQLVVRVRGGAVLRNGQGMTPALPARARMNIQAKQWIARWATDMIEDGDAIFVDASTTVFNIVPFLADHRNLTVVTNGIEIGRALARNPLNTVILVGGILRTDGSSVVGLMGEPLLSQLYIKTAFVSCTGFSFEAGLTERNIQEAQLKSQMIRLVSKVVALVDSSKFGVTSVAPFANILQIHHVVTDDTIGSSFIEQLRQSNIIATICGEDTVSSLTPAESSQPHYKIGFANLSENIPFAVDVRRSLERAAQTASNIDLVLADNQLNSEIALTVADSLIAQQVDLAIEYQIDEQIGSLIIDKFQRAAIPVIAVDIPMVGATFFGVDNYRAGYMAGNALGEWLRDHWDNSFDYLIVLEESRAGTLPAARIQGQLYGLQEITVKIPEAHILRVDSGNTSQVSEVNVIKVLQSLPNDNRVAVICFNDDAAMGALAAARKLKREQQIVIVGQGADRRVREEIRNPQSRIIGSTAFNPEKYGEKLIAIALKILQGEPLPPAIYVDHTFISAENLD